MKLSAIATLLNNTIVPNIMGESTTIAEDLRNVVDLGTAIGSLDGDSLKDYAKQFAVGVINNWFDERRYSRETYGLFMNEVEYGGALQRTRAKLLEASDTPILSLEDYNADSSAPDYLDGHYYGTSMTTKIYNKDVAFQIKYSIPNEMFKKSFKSAKDVQKLVSMIENNADNSLTVELNGLAKGILRKLILSANSSRQINLITTYNTEFGFQAGDAGLITLSNWKQSTAFKLWVEETIIKLRKYITEYNEKYNDGTVEVFCPEEDTRVCLLTELSTALDFAQSNVYHQELTSVGEYYTVNYWQNGSTSLLPAIASGSVHDQVKETVADTGTTTTTIDHVVGLIYDKYAAFMTDKLDKTTVQYVPAGDFNTMFHHCAKSYGIDTQATCISLVMA